MEDKKLVAITGAGSGIGEAAAKHGVKLYLEPINRYESHVVNLST